MAGGPITALVMHPVVKEELLSSLHMQRLDRACRLVDPGPFRSFDALGEATGRVQVLITSWGCPRIDRDVVATLPGLKLIAHLAGSVKGFIDEQVWRMGIQISNAVAANAVPVAEYTLAAILFANKRVLQLADFYRRHHENRAPWTREAPNVGNYHKIVGIIGASHVGRKTIELLQPFDLKVLVYDPYLTPMQARELGAQKVGLAELLSSADVASLHAPLLPETRHMLGAREFALLKDGATFINTARGAIVDHGALEAELVSGRLNAVLDTTEPEVLPASSPLYRLPNVLLTPHIAGSLGTETQRLADYIVDEVERFSRGQMLKFRVRYDELARLA
jgi:phosphoglycerate dehydrogenase-like enzyme